MVSKKIIVGSMTGIDVDCAGAFCEVAMKFPCHIEFVYNSDCRSNAKSMLSVLGAAISYNQEIELVCDGDNEQEALDALCDLIKRDFQKK